MIKQAILWCGGRGTRMGEYTQEVPKPMVKANGCPLVVYIMKNLYRDGAGIKDFVLLTGYLSDEFIRFFKNSPYTSFYDTKGGPTKIVSDIQGLQGANITILYTGEQTPTAERLKMSIPYIEDDEILLTYGDTLSTISPSALHNFFIESKKELTMLGVPISQRFGVIKTTKNGEFLNFTEKSSNPNELINGGYIVTTKKFIDDILDKNKYNIEEPKDFSYDVLGSSNIWPHLGVLKYEGFWKAVDTLTDLHNAEKALQQYSIY